MCRGEEGEPGKGPTMGRGWGRESQQSKCNASAVQTPGWTRNSTSVLLKRLAEDSFGESSRGGCNMVHGWGTDGAALVTMSADWLQARRVTLLGNARSYMLYQSQQAIIPSGYD